MHTSGATTILATAAIGITLREGLPRVSYATALDAYLNLCVVYEIAALIEYAAVNYFTKVLPMEGGADDSEEEREEITLVPPDQSKSVYLFQSNVRKVQKTTLPTSNGLVVPVVDT
jgi:hypothetical protein